VSTRTLFDLHRELREDPVRAGLPFSDDMATAARLMQLVYAADHEIAEGLNNWCRVWQPCQFGRLAAKTDQIHFCIIREEEIAESDDYVREKITREKRLWKQRAVYDTKTPPHSFLLVVESRRLERAAPDDNLKRFANYLLGLVGWSEHRRAMLRGENPVTSDYLYMRHPDTRDYVGFRFNIDFFAAAGDGRWWHDHRFPGGVAFTANATGHMKAFREWYSDRGGSNPAWALTQAMMTVARAHPTKPVKPEAPPTEQTAKEEGRLTWLLDLKDGRPIVERLPCPFAAVPKQLANKDWTKYEGWIHTDHAVREEFFAGCDDPVAASAAVRRSIAPRLPLNDLTYLYDDTQEEFKKFTAGKPFTQAEVFADVGRPEEWDNRSERLVTPRRTDDQTAEVAELLVRCRGWEEADQAEL
jgi:hypothetical protein